MRWGSPARVKFKKGVPSRSLRGQRPRGGADRPKAGAHLSRGPQQDALEEGQGGWDSGAQDRGQATLRGQERARGNGAERRAWSADLPIEMVGEAPERGPSLSLATGGLGEAEGKAEWAGRKWRPLHSPCLLSLPWPLPSPAPPHGDTGSGPGCSMPAHPGHRQATRAPPPRPLSDCCSHFPRLGRDTRFFQKHFLCKIILRNMFLEMNS